MSVKTRKCALCGRDFETTRPNKKYCSLTCKEARQKLQRMKWKDANPDYYKGYMKKYRESDKEGDLTENDN